MYPLKKTDLFHPAELKCFFYSKYLHQCSFFKVCLGFLGDDPSAGDRGTDEPEPISALQGAIRHRGD